MNVAEAITHSLVAEGITLAAGLAGTHIGRILDAIASCEEISLMYARQERVAFDICDGFARASGSPAVVFADSGPAAANLMGGLVNSWGDSIPVLFFAGHNDRKETSSRATKEIPFLDIFGPVSKWAALINDPLQVAEVMRRAFMNMRTGRPGPVVVGVPCDVSAMETENYEYVPLSSQPRICCGAEPAAVNAAIDLLGSAKKPYLYVGAGVLFSEATADLVQFAELLTLPVATTLNGKSAFPENHPLALGIGGFVCARYNTLPAALYAADADVILTIGCGFKQPATVVRPARQVHHIQIDIEPSELHRDHLADVVLLADGKIALRQLFECAKSRMPTARLVPNDVRLAELSELRERWAKVSAPLVQSEEVPINPFRVTHELMKLVDPARTIVLHDAGTVRGTTAQHYIATHPRSFLGFGVQSAMGWSIGAALGAKKACRDKLVIAIIGEEAFAETALDIETSVRNDAPVLVIVKNNRRRIDQSGGASNRLAQARFHRGIDIAALVTALGAQAYRVEQPADISRHLKSAIETVKSGKTAVVDIVTKRMNASLHKLWEDAR
jgi:acetolactate synthase-1/2/3 large subunit